MSSRKGVWPVLLAGLVLASTSNWAGQSPSAPPSATIFFVADILYPGLEAIADQTGQLMERLYHDHPGSTLIAGGDLCNDDGSKDCYDRLDETSWGPLVPLLYATPGNHDYQESLVTRRVPEFYSRFPRAGARELGYFGLDRGGWRLLGYNTELMRRDPVTSEFTNPEKALGELAWLDKELAEYSRKNCILAFGHRPGFSSGRNASEPYVRPIFSKLFKYGVDFNVVAHEHFLADLPPLDPDGRVDRAYGVDILIAGTGGAVPAIDPREDTALPQAQRRLRWGRDGEVLLANTPGIVKIDLVPGSYQWQFIPVTAEPGRTYPSGGGTCHDNPPRYVEPRYF